MKVKIDSSVIKHFFTYAFGALLLRCITVILTPLNMRKLTPEDYGTLALTNGFISITSAIIGLGLRQVLSLEYFHCTARDRKRLINEMIIMYAFFAFPLLSVFLYAQPWIATHIFLNKVPFNMIMPTLLITFLFFFVELFYQVLQYERKAAQLTTLQTTIAIITGMLTIFFVWNWNSGATGIVSAQLLGMTLAGTIAISTYTKNNYHHELRIYPRLHSVATYLKKGLPFIPTVLFGWLLSFGDRWILAWYAPMHLVGIYAIADMFGQLFYFLVLYPWAGSYLPYILNAFAKNKENVHDIEKTNKRVMVYSMICAAVVITIGYYMGKSLLRFILPTNYHQAIDYIWIILMGQVFLLGTYFSNCLIQFHKKTYFLAFSLFIPATLNIGLNILLIPFFSLYGCTIATLASYTLYFALSLWYNHHLLKRSTT